jgi:hypothetical protein
MLRTAFKLPLRRTEGLLTSVFTLMKLTISAPDHTTLSRRAVKLPVIQPAQVPHGELHVLIGSTGLQVYGAGQCLEAQHGAKSTGARASRPPSDKHANAETVRNCWQTYVLPNSRSGR